MPPSRSGLTLLGMTTRNLRRRPMRTLLTALGVAVGVAAIVAFTTMVEGMWDAVESGIHFDDADLIVFQANVAADLFSLLDEEETQTKLAAIPGVSGAVPTLWHVLPVEDQPFCIVIGLRLEDIKPHHQRYIVEGRGPTAENEVALGSIARRLFGKDLGDTLLIQGRPYRVVEIFQTDVVFFNGAIVMALPELQRLAGKEDRATAFQVFLQPGADATAVAGRIERENPELVAISDASEYKKVDQGLEVARGMVWAVSFIAIVIGSIIVTNTMWMSVLERTREIGVLRAVGWSHRQIVSAIVLEAAGVGLIGCLLGCLFGVGLAKVSAILPVAEQFLDPVFGITPFLIALAVAVLLSVVGAVLPAWRASRISPAEALRYE